MYTYLFMLEFVVHALVFTVYNYVLCGYLPPYRVWKDNFHQKWTVLLSQSAIITYLSLRNCHLVLNFACYLACHIILPLCDIITTLQRCVHLITYSCVDMCEHTNQYESCDHPKQMLLWYLAILLTTYDHYLLIPV